MAPPSAPSLDKTTRVVIGDVVSVAVGVFGQEYAEARGARPWRSEAVRDEGTIVDRANHLWVVRFADGAQERFERKAFAFVRRSTAAAPGGRGRPNRTPRRIITEADDEDEEATRGHQGEGAQLDSSDEDEAVGEADHGSAEGEVGGLRISSLNAWTRDDGYAVNERAKHGFNDHTGPRLNLENWESASLFGLAVRFLPMEYLQDMATAMQEKGKQKYLQGGYANYKNWRVSTDDLLQWIGVWMYFLAFPQAGHKQYSYK
ncbi:hypothetical protein AB1Y20_014282 [Prymnesium parvum]|uniref:Uncharacterized protein n=1 Tax=Prymnesium parvum TaxID=97485 RepID=A0AB34IFV6_PRYPA